MKISVTTDLRASSPRERTHHLVRTLPRDDSGLRRAWEGGARETSSLRILTLVSRTRHLHLPVEHLVVDPIDADGDPLGFEAFWLCDSLSPRIVRKGNGYRTPEASAGAMILGRSGVVLSMTTSARAHGAADRK